MTAATGRSDDAMAVRRTQTRGARANDTYMALVRRFPLRPIRDETALDVATAIIDELAVRDDLDPGEDDYLNVLGDLIERYEDKHHPIPDASEDEMLAFFIDQRGVKQVDVSRATGIAESTLSEVLRGKRQLTRTQITKLAAYFHVGPGVFLRSE
jgi:HTH-type transcriptional regulator/antitoxin HigA